VGDVLVHRPDGRDLDVVFSARQSLAGLSASWPPDKGKGAVERLLE